MACDNLTIGGKIRSLYSKLCGRIRRQDVACRTSHGERTDYIYMAGVRAKIHGHTHATITQG